MQVLIKIASTNRSNSVVPESLVIKSIITRRVDTCNLIVEDTTGSITISDYDEIIISNLGETTRYFGGFVVDIERQIDGVKKIFKCSCQDYTILLDRVLVNEVYQNKTDAYIINDLCTNYLAEVNGATYVETGLTHEELVFNRVTLRDALNKLSQLSGMDWYVDYNKNIHYFTEEINLATFGISDSPDNLATYPCSNLTYRRDSSNIVNRVTVIGGTYLSTDTSFEMPANNQTTEFLMPYNMHAPSGQSSVLVYRNDGNDVAPNWTALGVGVDYIDTLGGAIDVLHNYQQKLLKFNVAPPNLTRAIKVTARYDVPILMRVRSEESYDTYGRWFDDKLINKDITTREWAAREGKAILASQAFVKESGSFKCLADGLVAGQLISIVNVLRGIDTNYLIHEVTTRILGGTQCEYTVKYGEYNPDLVDLIISNKASAKQYESAREGEVLNELLEQDETLDLTEDTDRHEDATPGARWIAQPPSQSEGHHVEHETVALSGTDADYGHLTEAYRWNETGSFPYKFPIHLIGRGTKWDFFTWA